MRRHCLPIEHLRAWATLNDVKFNDTCIERITNPDATSEMYSDLTFMGLHQPGFYNADILDQLASTNPVTEETPDEWE